MLLLHVILMIRNQRLEKESILPASTEICSRESLSSTKIARLQIISQKEGQRSALKQL